MALGILLPHCAVTSLWVESTSRITYILHLEQAGTHETAEKEQECQKEVNPSLSVLRRVKWPPVRPHPARIYHKYAIGCSQSSSPHFSKSYQPFTLFLGESLQPLFAT